jgi:hypothetical protein
MTTKADILSAIRGKCLECCCGQPGEVRACTITACELWPFRFGSDPFPSTTRGFAKAPVCTDGSADGQSGSTRTAPSPARAENPSSTRPVFRSGDAPPRTQA